MIACLDANCVIYLIENNPVWGLKVIARVGTLRLEGHTIAVADLARAECLAKPLQQGNAPILADYSAFFADPDVQMLPMTAAVCERAARLRVASHFRLSLADCLHLACAIEHGCGLFLTNDTQLTRCTDIAVEVLK